MKNFLEEFKQFALKGNVMDMAIGVIIGGAFQSIVISLIDNIFNPLIGLFFSTDFSNVTIDIGNVSIGIGSFISAVLNFIIMAFILFCFVKTVNKIKGAFEEEKETAAPKKSDELVTLEKIVSLLEEKK